MNVDLLGTIRLLHRVLGFLAQQPADRLLDIADGRRHLLLSDLGESPAGPAQQPVLEARVDSRPGTRAAPKAGRSDVDYQEVVARLRSFGDLDEGVVYLATLRPGRKLLKADLLGLCRAADLEVSAKTSNSDLERKLLEHTIAARKKYAGLARW